ncbi:rRNA maturation RNase YbeY [Salinibacter sp. 10B]|uniref:rRNA maturation RNase YbeY n=1 Tax=Salinibacter sp. 10B TaxID=1923971 RepID=UPI000CF560C5|nr:rRNA maturation RNase YbeY [Salinibacter sp. 10B]PQJ33379.1 rRNA maturation RNase YbeY [Salinibacter sp. 10B]
MPSPYSESLSLEHDHSSLALDDEVLTRLIRHVVEAEEASLLHVSVVLSGHDTVRRLNQSYLDHDYNTDVLSFSLRETEDADEVEGEVYVDLDTAAERHEEFDTTFEREAYRYVVHGVLHLLGYDDATDEGQKRMRAKEDQYLDAVLSAASSP